MHNYDDHKICYGTSIAVLESYKTFLDLLYCCTVALMRAQRGIFKPRVMALRTLIHRVKGAHANGILTKSHKI